MEKIKILKKKYNSYPRNLDLLEAEQPGLDNTSLQKGGAYDEIRKESNAPSKAGHLHIQNERNEKQKRQIPSPSTPRAMEEGNQELDNEQSGGFSVFPSNTQTKDLLEVWQPGLDNISLKGDGVYDEIHLESNAPSKAGHLHIHGMEYNDTDMDEVTYKGQLEEAAFIPSPQKAIEILELGEPGLGNKTPPHPSPESLLKNNAPSTAGRFHHHNNKEEGIEVHNEQVQVLIRCVKQIHCI